jgi:hypothetical protein
MAGLDLLLYRRLQERIEEEKRNHEESLLSGFAANYEEYKNRVGYLKGLSDALIWAKETMEDIVGIDRKAR